MKALTIAACLSGLVMSAPASAEMVTSKNPQSLVKALQAAGFQAKLGEDSGGDPMITSASSGSSFRVLFYNCTANKDCQTVQFHCAYDTAPDKTPSLQRINEWNVNKRFTDAYLDKDGDPGLTMDLNLDLGGISAELFKDNLMVWTGLMAAYEEHIGW